MRKKKYTLFKNLAKRFFLFLLLIEIFRVDQKHDDFFWNYIKPTAWEKKKRKKTLEGNNVVFFIIFNIRCIILYCFVIFYIKSTSVMLTFHMNSKLLQPHPFPLLMLSNTRHAHIQLHKQRLHIDWLDDLQTDKILTFYYDSQFLFSF